MINLELKKEANYAKIIEFLGLNQDIKPKTNLKKQNPESLRKLVKNYDYLKEAFVGTEWHDFFEE
jgi:poly-gamma-glutamate capsule biosynthesis protein CapA/YwtB (metallophosphatase superfamily)